MRKEMSKSRARTDADFAKGKGKKHPQCFTSNETEARWEIFHIRTHQTQLTSFASDVLGKLIEPRGETLHWTTAQNTRGYVKTGLSEGTACSHLQKQFGWTHLINFLAKDLSFPVAAAAARSRSRLFPDSMCPRTPRRPSGDFEWSASTVWWT